MRRFIAVAQADRLYAVWLLSLIGLRRAEVLGLRWDDIDFTKGTVTIARTRVLVNGQVIEKCPKSKRSARTLPLFGLVTGALQALHDLQEIEAITAGEVYADCGDVAADELGEPLHPEWYSDEFGRLRTSAGLPGIRLHDTRATVNSYLEKLGVSENLRAAWLGHTVQVNKASYLPTPTELSVAGDAIERLFKAAPSKM